MGIWSYFCHIMSKYHETFDPEILIGQYDLISQLSDFA